MQNIIIGTAGHIDHGKTTLIKALTGRNTDKLQEEIKRGISINLGFTYFDLPSGNRAGIIDVPGHERFIKNMLAGAAGIDIALLTIAANEGVKPQTIEHVDILNYLDIKHRIIVLTKCGLAEDLLKELAIEDIRDNLKGTKFEGTQIIEVDSISRYGIDNLIKAVDEASKQIIPRNGSAPARLNIDRTFSIKGFGTIVTGTICEGNINVGDELTLYPKNIKVKIRNIQVHDSNVKTAYAGQRTALNISSIRTEDIERGDVLAKLDSLTETTLLDVKINLVAHTERTLKLWDRVRLYIGAKEVLARLVPLDADIIEAGDTCFCQLRLEERIVAKKDDKFVARFYSPMETIGGGVILDPNPSKHGKSDKRLLETLKIKDTGDILDIIDDFVNSNNENYTTLKNVSEYLSLDEISAKNLISQLIEKNILTEINGFYFHMNAIDKIRTKILSTLSKYHNTHSLRKGMSKEELKSKLKTRLKPKEFDFLLNLFVKEGYIKIMGNTTSLKGFEVVYDKNQLAVKKEISDILLSAKFMPPQIDTICKSKLHYEVLEALEDVVILEQNFAIHRKYYDIAFNNLYEYINKHGEITLAGFRDITGSSRKYAMLLLDYFDRNGITIRTGDKRILKGN